MEYSGHASPLLCPVLSVEIETEMKRQIKPFKLVEHVKLDNYH
jgi:hypothetical protein